MIKSLCKKGFFLLELGVALCIMIGLVSAYAWYMARSMQGYACMRHHLESITRMSSVTEQVTAGLPMQLSSISVRTLDRLPLVTGAWSLTMPGARSTGYALHEITMPLQSATQSQEAFVWYVGVLAKNKGGP